MLVNTKYDAQNLMYSFRTQKHTIEASVYELNKKNKQNNNDINDINHDIVLLDKEANSIIMQLKEKSNLIKRSYTDFNDVQCIKSIAELFSTKIDDVYIKKMDNELLRLRRELINEKAHKAKEAEIIQSNLKYLNQQLNNLNYKINKLNNIINNNVYPASLEV